MEGGDRFPIGLRVLVVDDDPNQLKILERLLIKCNYEVTVTTEAEKALEMLRENRDRFDIVISDVQMPRMDGFKLLELIGLELDIPVIMLSGDDSQELVMKGVRHGAVDYLLKPVSMGAIKNIWQHVIRKGQYKEKGKAVNSGDENTNLEEERSRKRKEKNVTVEEVDEEDDESKDEDEDEDLKPQKRRRVVWSPELHKKFVTAVDHLGPERAFPKKILDFMNVEGLTRENVASHLQKYRLYLKRLNSSSNHGAQSSSIYMNGGPVSNSYSVYRSLGNGVAKSSLGQMNSYSSGLSKGASSLGNVGNPRLMNIGHFQHQNINIAIKGLASTKSGNQSLVTNAKPQAGVLSLEDYTRRMEIWKNGPSVAQHNLLTRSQLPSRSFIGGFPYLQNSLDRPFVTPEYSCNAQNVSCNIVESQRWQLQTNESDNINISTAFNMDNLTIPNTDSSNQSFGHSSSLQYNSLYDSFAGQINADGASSFMQCNQVQDHETDALMRLDESYLLDSTELLDGFIQNNCETLEDLVVGLLKKDDFMGGTQ